MTAPKIEAPNTLTFTIMVELETGRVEIQGPIQQKVLALGVLEVAKDIVMKFDSRKASGLVRPAGPQWVG